VAERNAASEGVPLATFLRRLATRGADANQARVERALSLLGTLTRAEADAIRANVKDVREAWSRGRR
jgi:hypothetical protein